MRKMFSKNQIGEIVKQGMDNGTIPCGINPIEIARFEIGTGIDDISMFEVGKIYACFIGSYQTSNIFFLIFCQSGYGNAVYFTSSNYLYDGSGDLVFSCLLTLTSSGSVQFANDDGPITMSPEDELVIYKL